MTNKPPTNAEVIAELQAISLGIHMVGLDRLPEVMTRTPPTTTCIEHQAGRPTQRLSFQIKVF
jgi:hypothetical protein